MEKNKIGLVVALCAVMGFIIALGIYYFYIIVGSYNMPMDLWVRERPGINAGSDALHFGAVPPGEGSGLRNTVITNSHDFPIEATAYLSGDLALWVTVSQNDIVLQPGEDIIVEFRATPPKEAEYGNYTGNVRIVYKRVW